MTLNFLGKRRTTSDCSHHTLMRTEIAGMSREVCEGCGRVSVAYIEDHFHASRSHDTARPSGSGD